ncbi:MAG TPA: tRNA (adenosine(37)-N6)-threonylcarbamoyltransferase complex ATPase subunit type 1 TsaE [Clostridiales bacterium]|nr:tRNA (adenosine(37)-N6)-threonylcarbamoyltransferase complex ATPase subunit type 1 TsaE [Clostridiales bacterium]
MKADLPRRVAILSRNRDATIAIGLAVGRRLAAGDFVALRGPLGAGKTCFAQGLLTGLEVRGGGRSPTFVLMYCYEGRVPVCHLDAYRLNAPEELLELGWEELLSGPAVVILEWSDRATALLPPDRLEVELEPTAEQDDRRLIALTATGDRHQALIASLDPGR